MIAKGVRFNAEKKKGIFLGIITIFTMNSWEIFGNADFPVFNEM